MTARALLNTALAAWLGLFVLLVLWGIWLAPPAPPWRAPWLVLLVGPLLLPLRALMRGRRYTFAWSSMLVLVYFIHGVSAAATGQPLLGGIEIALSLVYFAAAIGYVRASRTPAQAADSGRQARPGSRDRA